MNSLSLSLRVVLGLAVAILLVKVVSDKRQTAWYPKKLPKPEDTTCPDLTLGPEPHLAWPNWAPFADVLADEVAKADKADGYDVLFYGDSITEQWRGTAIGAPYPGLKAIREVFDTNFNRNYTSHVLAIAGDQVGHLWWRLANGEIPSKKLPKASVVLIGTNDLTADDCHETEEASMIAVRGIVSRLRQMLWLMRSKLPDMHIVLVGILPRDAKITGPPAYEWPNRMTEPIALANFEYRSMAEADDRVHYLDCGAPYTHGGGGLDAELLPDALHPNAAGMEQLARCMRPLLDDLILPPARGAQGI